VNLYQKHRPTELKDIIGNGATIGSLQALIDAKERPHTVLITGPSGSGKTTIARILARKFGCSDRDTIELNTANFRGVDTAREIIQQVRLKPMDGESRAWILDEAHKMTNDGQSALMKVLEDTPSHVYFFIATTDPQKLLKTIVNRCVQFTMQALPENRIAYLVNSIAEKEGITLQPGVTEYISKNCQGSCRLALNMLEKIIGLEPERQLHAVAQATQEETEIIDLCRALVGKKSWATITDILKRLQETEPEQVRLAVLNYCHKVLLSKDDPAIFLIMDSFKTPWYSNGKAGLTMACYEAISK
jgi:DNA polymerase-3 subunit gamma/tau